MSDPTVLLVRPLPAQHNRSMERYADELAEALGGLGRVRVEQIGPAAASWSRLPLAARLERRLSRFAGYRRQLTRRRADIFHITDHSYADLAAALPPERTVVTCHDLILLRAERGDLGFRGGRATVSLFRRRVAHLRRVAHVACISEQTRDDLVELVGVDRQRTSVIPNGVDPRFTPLPPERRAALRTAVAAPDTAIILHVSTGDPYKNVEGTLRTLARLRSGGTDAILVRAGRPLRPEQQALAATLGVAAAVRELGRVADDRLVELYNLADVLLFPSHYEGFGWPPLEAMACGTPVVTSEAAALVEVTGDAALHAPATDASGLADAVLTVLEDPTRAAALAAAGMARAERYQWSATAEAFADRYEELLRRASDVPGR